MFRSSSLSDQQRPPWIPCSIFRLHWPCSQSGFDLLLHVSFLDRLLCSLDWKDFPLFDQSRIWSHFWSVKVLVQTLVGIATNLLPTGPKLCRSVLLSARLFSVLFLFSSGSGRQNTNQSPSHYSYDQASLLPSHPSGMFPSFCQTGPGDLNGSAWDAAAEGQQNFPELDQGDLYNVDTEDMMLPFGQPTPRLDQDGSDDLTSKWTADLKAPKSEPMRRLTSKSSAGSSKNRTLKASKKAPRPRVHSPLMARTSSQYSNYEVTGNASVFQEATIGNGRMMDPQQYLAQDLDTLSVSSHMTGTQAFNSGLMGFPTDGLPYAAGMGFAMGQHVNPCATQIYDTGLAGSSPYSLGSLSPDSRNSSPGADDTWSAGPLIASPTTDAHDSPPLNGPSPRYVSLDFACLLEPFAHRFATSG